MRLVSAWWPALVLGCSLAAPAAAHSPSVAHVQVRPLTADGSRIEVELDVSLRDLALTLALDANRDERVTWGELLGARADLDALVASNLEVGRAGGACVLAPVALATRRYEDGAYASVRLRGRCAGAGPFLVRYGLLFDRDPGHRAIVTLLEPGDAPRDLVDAGAAPPAERATTGIARAGARTVRLDPADDAGFVAFLREGIHHILIGYDTLRSWFRSCWPRCSSGAAGDGRRRTAWHPGFRTWSGWSRRSRSRIRSPCRSQPSDGYGPPAPGWSR